MKNSPQKIILIAGLMIVISIIVILTPRIGGLVSEKMITHNLSEIRNFYYGDVPKRRRGLVGFGDQIQHEALFGPKGRQNDVEDYLNAGYDPNYCLKFNDGWQYRNPLMLFNSSFINLTYNNTQKEAVEPDVVVFDLLVANGADVNKYPYVWASVYLHDNKKIEVFKKDYPNDPRRVEALIACYISDANRVLRMFLEAGSDVNRKGHKKPFDKKYCTKISELQIQKLFDSDEATTPIYEAIKKGMLWESQVDLLLEYGAEMDESCLEAARLSDDEAMIRKITGLLYRGNGI